MRPRFLLPAVALASAGSLAYEILLVRVFSIEYFHHFAYLAVGIAMLGLGAAGTAVTLAPDRPGQRLRWLAWAVAAAPLSLAASPTLVQHIPLDPTQLAWDPAQWPRLGLAVLVLAIPFAATGLVVLLALASSAERPGGVYAASFLGAGAGAAASLAAAGACSPDRALAVPALLAAAGAAVFALPRAAPGPARLLAWMTLPVAAIALASPPWRLALTPYKGLPQVEAYPGARRVAEEPGPLGWLVQVEAPAFRYAPGLSLAFRGAFPRQSALFVDGDLAGASSTWRRVEDLRAFVDHLPTAAPYALGSVDRVLVVGAGEGLEALNAAAHGAREVFAVELNPALARRALEQRPEDAPPPRWITGDARGYLARTRERFDLITMGAGAAFGSSVAGLHSLDEDFLHTTEAYELYLDRLAGGGLLSVTRWLAGPPREPVRTLLTVCEALRRVHPGALPRALVVMRSWATVTVLVKPSGFSPGEIGRLRAWAADRALDLDWYPGIGAPPSPAWNHMESPVLHDAARAGVAGPRPAAAFAAAYPFLVSPASDARPYTRHFLRPGFLPALLRPDRAAYLPIAEWGLVALLATLLWSVLLAGLLLLAPVLFRSGRAGLSEGPRLIGYFSLLGFSYLAAEIAAIQQLSLLLGHPVYAVAAALTGLLVGSGLGSAASDRLSPRHLPPALAGLLLLLAAEALFLLPLARAAQPAPLAARAAAALAALLPPAVLMGLPFPLGLRRLAQGRPPRVAWAWAANGFASVVAAPLSALIALEWGSRVLFLSAAGGYAAALLLLAADAFIPSPGGDVKMACPPADSSREGVLTPGGALVKLVACPNCHAQYDLAGVSDEAIRCPCGTAFPAKPPEAVDAAVTRCAACGALVGPTETTCTYCEAEVTRRPAPAGPVCPECYARNPEKARFCTACGVPFLPQPVRTGQESLGCPVCAESRLGARNLGGVWVDECPACLGLWTPGDVLDRLIDRVRERRRGQGAPPGTRVRAGRRSAWQAEVAYRRCPVCRSAMQRKNFGHRSGVILDWCGSHGTWLDAHELEDVADFVLEGGLERAPAPGEERSWALPADPGRMAAIAVAERLLAEEQARGLERNRRRESGPWGRLRGIGDLFALLLR